MAKAKKVPTAVAEKWAERLGNAGDAITNGVQSVTVAPGKAAADHKADYIRRVQERADRWAKRVAAVSLQDWQKAVIDKGVPIIGQRAQMATGKMDKFMQKFLPAMYAARDKLPPKQKGNIDNAMSRVRAIVQAAIDFGKQNQ